MKTEHRRLKSASELKYSERTWKSSDIGFHILRRLNLYQLKLLQTGKSSSSSSLPPPPSSTEVRCLQMLTRSGQRESLLENKLVDEFNQGGELVRRRNSTLRKLMALKKWVIYLFCYVSFFVIYLFWQCDPHLRMNELKSLARWGRKILLSKICCHNLEWEWP